MMPHRIPPVSSISVHIHVPTCASCPMTHLLLVVPHRCHWRVTLIESRPLVVLTYLWIQKTKHVQLVARNTFTVVPALGLSVAQSDKFAGNDPRASHQGSAWLYFESCVARPVSSLQIVVGFIWAAPHFLPP